MIDSAVPRKEIIESYPENDEFILPIGASGIGGDPRYGDNFNIIKAEIDKLSDTDYEKVSICCEQILREESKDLRVAGYYLLAKVYLDGLAGLMKGVKIYNQLVNIYGKDLYPKRESAKQQSFDWLNNDKLNYFVNKIEIETEEEKDIVESLEVMIDEINDRVSDLCDVEEVSWTSIKPWLNKNTRSNQNVTLHVHKESDSHQTISTEKLKISSELVFTRTIEQVLAYLINRQDWNRLISISRSTRWSVIQLPYNEDGLTKIEPPRQQVITFLQNLGRDREFTENITTIETYFMEPGCLYYLDLQKYEVEFARQTGQNVIADLVELHAKELIKRVPKIIDLSYRNGMPFADNATRNWMKRLTDTKSINKSREEVSNNTADKVSSIVHSHDLIDIKEKISHLDKLDVTSGLDEFIIMLAKIELCMSAGRDDLALSLANALEQRADKYALHKWDRSLAIKLWDILYQLLSSQESNTDENNKRLIYLKQKICNEDLAFAMNNI